MPPKLTGSGKNAPANGLAAMTAVLFASVWISGAQAGPYVMQCLADGKTEAFCRCSEQVLQQQLPAADFEFLQKVSALQNSGQASSATFQQLLTESGRTEAGINTLLQRVEAMNPLIMQACAG